MGVTSKVNEHEYVEEANALHQPLFASESPPVELSPAMREDIHQADSMLESP